MRSLISRSEVIQVSRMSSNLIQVSGASVRVCSAVLVCQFRNAKGWRHGRVERWAVEKKRGVEEDGKGKRRKEEEGKM